jgi:hypothetical protein
MKAVLLLSLLLTAPAFASKEGVPRVLPKSRFVGNLAAGMNVHWHRVPLADGGKALRLDVYGRESDGSYVLRQTIVRGKHKNGTRFVNMRDYVPIAERVPRARRRGEDPRGQGLHRVVFPVGKPPTRAPSRSLRDLVLDGLAEVTHTVAHTIGFGRVPADIMSQTTTWKDGSIRTLKRVGLKDTTLELSDYGRFGVERPFKIVK